MDAKFIIETKIFATLGKIIERHKSDREACLAKGQLTAASIYAIKEEAVLFALLEITKAYREP